MVIAVFAYLSFQIALIIISCYGVITQKKGELFKYIRKIVNYQYLFTVRVLSGPFLALCVNVLYCSNNAYHQDQTCYDAVHIIFCLMAVAIFFCVLIQILFFTFFYYIKNPLSMSVLAENSRFYNISKTGIKIFFPFYFAFDSK